MNAFTPILRSKNENGFTWEARLHQAFKEIKKYLSTLPVLRASRSGAPFRLYIMVEGSVIGAVFTQVTKGKEHIITYISRRLLDVETRYTFIKKIYAFRNMMHVLN